MRKLYSIFFYCFIPDSASFLLNKINRGAKNTTIQHILLLLIVSALCLYSLFFNGLILHQMEVLQQGAFCVLLINRLLLCHYLLLYVVISVNCEQ